MPRPAAPTKKVPFQYNDALTREERTQAERMALLQKAEAMRIFQEMADDSEDEGIEDYKLGGYHPVHVGEVL
jgi:hypothetical protein